MDLTKIQVNFVRLLPDAVLPTYAHEGDSGFDLYAAESLTIRTDEVRAVSTGFSVELPEPMPLVFFWSHPLGIRAELRPLHVTFELQVRPKSGLALNKKITVYNTPGTVDFTYQGEIKVIISSKSNTPYEINVGDKIAQGVIVPVICSPQIELVEGPATRGVTSRGAGGFGSTGYSSI